MLNNYQTYIHRSRYARWREDLGRRETWEETVERYYMFFSERTDFQLDEHEEEIKNAILNLEVMPSMRCMMTAGPALDRDNVAGFNCSFTAVSGEGEKLTFEHEKLDEPAVVHLSKPIDFDEIMYVLMCGTGVGFSVERQFIQSLPVVGEKLNRRIYAPNNKNYPHVDKEELSRFDRKTNTIHVHDSKTGWASATRILIVELFNGNYSIQWDVSQIRPSGAVLKTFGGRASGPEPLADFFKFAVDVFTKAEGRKLNSLEVHDLVCKIADIVVVGGVRRSALISLSNLTDERMRRAKMGEWWEDNPQRALANNSVCYTEKPDIGIFMEEWSSLYESRSGERGVFNREAATKAAGASGRRQTEGHDYGTNPCSEIILRRKQFCNLSEVVVRESDDLDSLRRKVRIATILGTLQATLTDFRYLSPEWKKNTEEEALLGVSLTGIMDHPVLSGNADWTVSDQSSETDLKNWLEELRNVAIATNKEWADKLGINRSAAITCVKPSGTVSQLVDSASGIHPRYSRYYIRTVRNDKKDPISQFLIDQGVSYEEDVMNTSNYVFSFPMKAPDNAVLRNDMSAINQLELWKIYAEYWCEHKPSITVYVKEDEWMEVGAWVYANFDYMSGVSFLPHTDHSYRQAPYQEIDEEEYSRLAAEMPNVDWDMLSEYESSDETKGSQELACTGGQCEI